MHENIITWNVTNMITVVLMAAIGFTLLGTAMSFYQKRKGGMAKAA